MKTRSPIPQNNPQEATTISGNADGKGNDSKLPVCEHEQPSMPHSAKVDSSGRPSVHKATGPRTIQGKQRSKINALKNGLYSKAILLKDESRTEYESLLGGLREDLRPQGKLEAVLVETLAGLLWRMRRLIQVESAEISKMDFLKKDSLAALQVQELDYAQPEGAFVGQASAWGNLAAVRAALKCQVKHQICNASVADSLEASQRLERCNLLFGHPNRYYVDDRDYLESIRLTAEFTKGAKIQSGQYSRVRGEALDAEVKRLEDLYYDMVSTEIDRAEANVRAARIPSEEVSDRLLRYEAHLSREFDRTMTRLERLQRIRKGQSLPPQLDVKIS